LIKKKPPERGVVSLVSSTSSAIAKNDKSTINSGIKSSGGGSASGNSSAILEHPPESRYKVGDKQSANVRDLTIRAADVTNDPEYQKITCCCWNCCRKERK